MSPQKPGESNQAQGAPLGIMIDWFPPSMREGVLPNSDKEIFFVLSTASTFKIRYICRSVTYMNSALS